MYNLLLTNFPPRSNLTYLLILLVSERHVARQKYPTKGDYVSQGVSIFKFFPFLKYGQAELIPVHKKIFPLGDNCSHCQCTSATLCCQKQTLELVDILLYN